MSGSGVCDEELSRCDCTSTGSIMHHKSSSSIWLWTGRHSLSLDLEDTTVVDHILSLIET